MTNLTKEVKNELRQECGFNCRDDEPSFVKCNHNDVNRKDVEAPNVKDVEKTEEDSMFGFIVRRLSCLP